MFWKKKKTNPESTPDNSVTPTWNEEAKQALDQAVSKAPAPSMIKGRLKKELAHAAEQEAQKNGHFEVTAEDLMHGMLAKLPANMREKVATAMQKGPIGLQELEKDLKNK